MSVNKSKMYKILVGKAKKLNKSIVLPEAEYSDRILKAGLKCAADGIASIVLLAKSESLAKYAKDNVRVVNILKSDLSDMLASALYVKRKDKGVTKEDAINLIQNELYFATMMVELGLVDGMVAGAENATSDVLRPGLQIIKAKHAGDIVSSVMFLSKGDDVVAFSDCALNINPTAEELTQITNQTVASVQKFLGIKPNVALLSYSTNGSGKGESADKVRKAVELLKKQSCDFAFDGEMQLDCAVDQFTRSVKYKNSVLVGSANTFIFPNLDSGNIGYKLVSRYGGYVAVGPLIQGLKAPVNDVSRGATIEEIILIIAATAIEGE